MSQAIGSFVSNDPHKGVRSFPYSTSLSINPLTYATLNDKNFKIPHQIGQVWASMLFETYWNLVNRHGFHSNLKSGVKSRKGNTVFVIHFFILIQLMNIVTTCCRWNEISAMQSQFYSS